MTDPPETRNQAMSPTGDSVAVYAAGELATIAASLGHGPTGKTLGTSPSYSYIQGRRTVSGEPEIHDHWADIAVVQAGRATLLAGGHVQGAHDASPGEHRGGTIVGGTEHTIAPGDLYIIPAGVPHQIRLAPGETLTYLTVKAPGGS